MRQINAARVVDVDKHRQAPGAKNSERGREGGEWRGQHLVAGFQAETTEPNLERIKTVARPDAVGSAPKAGQLVFERFDFGAMNIPAARAHSPHGAQHCRLDKLPLTFEIVLQYRRFGPGHLSIYPAASDEVSIHIQR